MSLLNDPSQWTGGYIERTILKRGSCFVRNSQHLVYLLSILWLLDFCQNWVQFGCESLLNGCMSAIDAV